MCNLSTIGTDRQEALMQVLREDGGSQIVRERHRMDEGHVMSLLELRNGLYLLNVRSLSLLFDRNIEAGLLASVRSTMRVLRERWYPLSVAVEGPGRARRAVSIDFRDASSAHAMAADDGKGRHRRRRATGRVMREGRCDMHRKVFLAHGPTLGHRFARYYVDTKPLLQTDDILTYHTVGIW